jgi:hypothetical protein
MRSELITALRLLMFRASSEEVRALNLRHFTLGLVLTWLVGIGRWWEDPKANFFQHLGIGSVIYVLFLSFFLWLILWPLAPRHWSLINVLAFVSLTSPPAILYAIPVRHGLELHAAQTVRLWMLAIVAGWRVALLIFYLQRTGFYGPRIVLAALFPLTLIIFALTAMNLEKVVFDFMGGIRQEDRTVNDTAYGMLFLITMISFLLFLPLLATYLVSAVRTFFARFGRRTGYVVYAIAVVCGMSGLCLYNLGLPAFVLIGTSIVLALTAAIEMNAKTKNEKVKGNETV